ncbi:MAG: sugar phosphate isomerase/epimerase [Anaerolineae bacterium]|nr:sugar phosphate isomerase/epimerase [Anaerolineae bacterium]
MKLGFLTACLRGAPLEEIVPWAAESGFQALELACWPMQNERDYSSSTLDVSNFTPARADEVKALFAQHNMEISCLTYCDNNLAPDPGVRQHHLDHLGKVIDAAGALGVRNVSTFVGRDPSLTEAENVEEAIKVFTPILEHAADKGVHIAIENCPMPGWQFEGLAGNIAYSPKLWDALFEHFPADVFGLNLDPSHLWWLGIDPVKVVRDYAERIFHVHAKDTEILPEKREQIGILIGRGWWRYRMPGLGEIPWARFISTLNEVGYDYVLSIEHEDPVWEGSHEKVKQGLVLGRRFLSQFVI